MANTMELLAPAGGMDAFEAAVKAGADAVYMGGSAFSARQYAGNFDDQSLKYALNYAHLRGVKVYITVNTLVRDDEFNMLLSYLEMLYESGADGLIVQDMGIASLVKKYLPDMPLHASTQMTIHNAYGATMLKDFGFKRVVPARELSLEEISHMAQTSGLELEVFVHGAMCYAYSGQCLMSSFMGGRSGNRGRCAQPCRMLYSLQDENGMSYPPQYLLSMKDLCLIEDLSALADAGVTALKIEGRMKGPEYVAVVTSKYRKALDRLAADTRPLIDPEDMMQLMQVFNRGGFSKGYLYGKSGIDMISPEKPDNWGVPLGMAKSYDPHRHMIGLGLQAPLSLGDGIEIRDGAYSHGQIVTYMTRNGQAIREADTGQEVFIRTDKPARLGTNVYKTSDAGLDKKLKTWLKTAQRRIDVNARVAIVEDRFPTMEVWDSNGHYVKYTGAEIVQQAEHAPLQKERITEQINRVGDMPFRFNNIEVKLSPNAWLPVSAINDMRRQTLEQLAEEIIVQTHRKIAAIPTDHIKTAVGNVPPRPLIYVMLDKAEHIRAAIKAGVDGIYLRLNARQAVGQSVVQGVYLCHDAGIPVIWAMPRIARDRDLDDIKDALPSARALYNGMLVSDTGQIRCAKDAGIESIYGDFPLNIFNSGAVAAYACMGIRRFTPSLELTLDQIRVLSSGSPIPMELIIHGRLPLMVAEGCPIGATAGHFSHGRTCSKQCIKHSYSLRDRKGKSLPVRTYLSKSGCYIEILNAYELCMADKIKDLLPLHPYSLRLDLSGYDGEGIERIVSLYKKALDSDDDGLKGLCGSNMTRGHYYRGVE
ncbi:MAG: family peptidase [Clostridiales bacterium]|nr:family peptidase [Clostridiales bacterium]